MTPRQVSKDEAQAEGENRKRENREEEIETSEGMENDEKEKEVERNMMENLFVNVFSSTVCDVILKEQEEKNVNQTHQLPCLKRKLVHSALLCIWFAHEKQIRQTQCMELFIVTYQGGGSVGKRGDPRIATVRKEQN